MSSLDDRMTFDMVKYRVESAPYITIARTMRALGCGDSNLKILFRKGFGIEITPGDNPDIYFVVTEETMQQLAQDMQTSAPKNEEARERVLLGLKVGTSPAFGLTEEEAKDNFEKKVRTHNDLQ